MYTTIMYCRGIYYLARATEILNYNTKYQKKGARGGNNSQWQQYLIISSYPALQKDFALSVWFSTNPRFANTLVNHLYRPTITYTRLKTGRSGWNRKNAVEILALLTLQNQLYCCCCRFSHLFYSPPLQFYSLRFSRNNATKVFLVDKERFV